MNKASLARFILVPAFFAALLGFWWAFPPSQPIGSADGIYANDCCGSITLENGRMSLEGQEVSYVVENDKVGRYVLPTSYVGVVHGTRVEINTARNALKLRLDDGATPTKIALWGDDALTTYDFRKR